MSENKSGEGQEAVEELVDEAQLENVTGGATYTVASSLASSTLKKAPIKLKPVLDISSVFQDMDAHRS